MSGTGRVVDVVAGTVPNSNRHGWRVLVDRENGERLLFYVPDGPRPAIGDDIAWGPRHAIWGGQRVDKISWEIDPTAPLR